jgi:hypothetical protein
VTLFCTLVLPGTVMADEWDEATKLSFSEAVEVPGRFFPRAPIGSLSRTTIQIATSFRSGRRTARTG